MTFEEVSLNNIKEIYQYTSEYGEGSCQHSPVSMYSLAGKYGDSVCMEDGFLYVLRSGLCDDTYRVYLAPMGKGNLKKAYGRILSDAADHGKKARFYTLTKTQADLLQSFFPGEFDYSSDRDLAEYILSAETMLHFPGKAHARRRTEIRSFWRDWREWTEVREIREEDLDEVAGFARQWLQINAETHDEAALNLEMEAINRQLSSYSELGLSGTLIKIDGKIRAFCYGVPLSDDYYDVLIEKGSRDYPGLYRVLRQESTKLNVKTQKYINFEEDLGVVGLRRIKESYRPEFMIEKYVVVQK